MKVLRYIAITIVALVVLFVGVGMTLPTTTQLERSIDIEASPGVVFSLVGSHGEFARWSPWAKKDPEMQRRFEGPEIGVGSTLHWESDHEEVGSGTSVYTEYTPNSRAVTAFDFGEMGKADASFDIVETATGVTITWDFNTEHEGVVARYFGLMMDGILGPVYEEGLQALKALAESLPPVKTQEVSYEVDGVTLTGYLAYPVGQIDPVPGVLVVHEWWGHNAYARKRAAMLAEQGYTALALDMYGDGKVATHPEDAGKFMKEVGSNSEVSQKRFDAAVELLKSQSFTDGDRLAAVGYCFGGSVVMNMARLGKDLDGVVSVHGGIGGLSPISDNTQAKFLVLNGQDDPWITEEHKATFKSEMDEANIAYEFVDYPGAKHAFSNPDATEFGKKFNLPLEYNEDVDKESWQRMISFLNDIF